MPSTHQRYHAFHGSTVAPSSPHNTHSKLNSAFTRVLFKPQNPLFPHWSIHITASNTSLATRTRHNAFIARSLSTHSLSSRRITRPRFLAQSNFLPRQVSLHSANTRFHAFPVVLERRDAADPLSVFRSRKRVEGERMRPCGLSRCQGPLPLATLPLLKATRPE